MNPAPLPQPAAITCPNCGAAIDGEPPFCPRCGVSLRAIASKRGGCAIIGAQIFLGLMAIVLGLCGACFVLLGGVVGLSGDIWVIAIGVGILALAGLCVRTIIHLAKR